MTQAAGNGLRISEEELGERLSLALGAELVRLAHAPSRYATSASLEEVGVELADGRQMTLMFKDLSRSAMLADALRYKPAFLYDPRREIEVYRQILSRAGLGTARCHLAVADSESERFWLVLEKVAGIELYQVGETEKWEHAARWLARMHRRLARFRCSDQVPWLRHDRDHYRRFAERAHQTLARLNAERATLVARWLERRYDHIVEELVGLPVTVIHGEFQASNVLVGVRGAGGRVCPVDWEMAALGPGLTDLAALVSGRWNRAKRWRIVRAYRAALGPDDSLGTDHEFTRALKCCRLALCVQWLGWAAGWVPPAEHAYDWLGAASDLIKALDSPIRWSGT